MKAKLLLPSVLYFTMFVFFRIWPCSGTVVTFDDISNIGSGTVIANGYQGLNWTNFGVLNAFVDTANHGLSGYYYGMVTPSNVAFNGSGFPAEIDARGTNFNFLGAYLTGAWNSNLNVEVQGFRGSSLMYDQIVIVAATSSTQFAFNYLDIDRLYFNSFGGQNAGFPSGLGEHFAMDNLSFEFVPEPSSLLLTFAGALVLRSLLKHGRRVGPERCD